MKTILAAVILAASIVHGANAEEIKVEGSTAVLRRDKRYTSPVVAELKSGQTIPVLQRDKNWIYSEAGGKKGWASQSWLVLEKGGIAQGLKQTTGAVSGSAQADAAEATAATTGVTQSTAQYAVSKNYNTAGLDRLIKLREQVINSGELEAFAREGKVATSVFR